MQLGRTYLAAGRTVEAAQIFKRVTQEFPNSPYVAEARRQVDSLRPGA
jgi:outer membrane protein assembly factor BamD (BamD/ComL family)